MTPYFMSVTVCLTVMQDDKRGEPSRKTPRLPPIAPKDDQASSASSSPSVRINAATVAPRTRLPPRSRTGCWTCRTRKVKCDEGRPVCGQCSRLGHTCDYNPRLSFRNDTPRVVERMQDVTTAGSFIWDRVASPATSSGGSTIDDLGPFATLLTDEDRERKAEASTPGTFNVIVNPESFQNLTEYSQIDVDSKRMETPLRRGSTAASLASSFGRDSMIEAVALPDDPNIVILPRFEDLSRRSTKEQKSPISPATSARPGIKLEEEEPQISLSGPEITTLRHFRDVVWKQLVPPEHGPDSSIVLLDEAAAQFPPLIRAMMAVGSLAISQSDGSEPVDSLQYYSQTLPELQNSLRCEEDLASDGAFLTHFLLLIYEVATADVEHPNMWLRHISTLLKITLLRRRILGGERFPFIVWWVCNLDVDALLTGPGLGDFVGHMLNHDLIPPPSFHLYPLGADGSSVVYPEEKDCLPVVLQLSYEVTLHAIRLGLLARELRLDESFDASDVRRRSMATQVRQSRVSGIREGLRQLWASPSVQGLGRMRLSVRPQRLFHHAWTLYQACIIYSHTSMWPRQRLDMSPDCETEINAASQHILQVSRAIIENDSNSSQFMVFPLFMAGLASTIGREKMLAIDLIKQMEEGCIVGGNTKAAREALEAIYELQNEQFMHDGHSLDIDWFQVMIDKGRTVVNFGL